MKSSESQTIKFTLTNKELGFYNNQGKFVVESGAFDVMVGGSSAEVLRGSLVLE